MTKLQEVKTRMQQLLDGKAAEIAAIEKKQAEERADLEKAEAAMQAATEGLNLDDYATAAAAKTRAQNALEMYSGALNALIRQEYISEKDSDDVIESLLSYERQIEAEFKDAVKEPLSALAKVCDAYRGEVRDTEATIAEWTEKIHWNFSTRGSKTFVDPESGERTDRSPTPVPVHRFGYFGCEESSKLAAYLKDAEALYKDQ